MRPSSKFKPRGISAKRELDELGKQAQARPLESSADLVHITSVGWGRRIVDNGSIEKRTCPVFGVDLVYFFLSRPAYRFKRGAEKNNQINFFPFAILVSAEKLPPPHHVYPFDTGAFMGEIFDDVLDPSIYLEDYELEPSLEGALRQVQWGFGSQEAYFRAKIKPGLEEALPDWRSVARSWISIAALASVENDKPDARASAIEFAYSRSVTIDGTASLIIFPEQLLEDPRGTNTELVEKLKLLNVPIRTYQWRANETPDSYLEQITSLISEYLFEKEIV